MAESENIINDISLIPQHRIENLESTLQGINDLIDQFKVDVNEALKTKTNDSDAVHIYGDEEINGIKTFNKEINTTSKNAIRIKNGSYGTIIKNDGTNFSILITEKDDVDGSPSSLNPFVINFENGLISVITPDDDDDSDHIPTTKWVKNQLKKVKVDSFVFEQGLASDTWSIVHNLNRYPSVTIVDSANTEVEGDIQYIDKNNIIIKFSGPFSGKAFLN